MTLTLAEARNRVRLRLEDTGAATVWSDEEIDAGLGQALDEYSHRYPTELRAQIAAEQDDTSIELPEGARQVKRVIDPTGRVVSPQTIPVRGAAGTEQAWEVWGNRIEFNRRLSEGTVEIRYTGARQLPTDEQAEVPVPGEDVSLLASGAVAWCLEQRSVADWKRGSLPARYETVLRRAREEYRSAWRARERQIRTGRMTGTA